MNHVPRGFPRAGLDQPGPIVHAHAPLQIILGGAGTDVPAYADAFGGALLTLSIDHAARAAISPRDDGRLSFQAEDLAQEETQRAAAALPGSHFALHRAVYERMVREFNGVRPLSVSVTTAGLLPPGSGLCGASALTVALVRAFADYLDQPLSPADVARLAFQIERVDLGRPGGQAHLPTALGGVTHVEFPPGNQVRAEPLHLSRTVRTDLASALVLCATDMPDNAAATMRELERGLFEGSAVVEEALDQIRQDVAPMRRALEDGDLRLLAAFMDRSWQARKRIGPSMTNPRIEHLENVGRRNHALGVTLCGAGGGHLVFLAAASHREQLIAALQEAGASIVPVRLAASD